ncbi:hypothetical protein ACFWYW_28445 [Nonomuraea sp. NPDC059023]|uniref:hypothetical protein n=1 Tax=unclassified Nonomuraea TaxID=2593643 RepID=UPI0036B62628
MSAPAISLVQAYPSPFEVAVLHLVDGAVARVHHPFGVKDYHPSPFEDEAYAVIPGDKNAIGWGAVPCWHYSLRGIRNGRHRLDRAAWHAAAALLRMGPVVYVTYEERDYYGKPRWTAVAARPAEQARGAA